MKEDRVNGEPTACGKVGYTSEKRAATAMHTIKNHKSTAKTKIPRRYYYCSDCGYYHLTNMLKK